MTKLKEEIQAFFKGEVSEEPAALDRYSRDASLFEVRPSLIAHPRDSEDICLLVNYVNQTRDQKLSITPRSGGTDMTGGPLNESIILDVHTHLNQIQHFVGSSITSEPGVYYRDFERVTKKRDLIMPAYPASREICTVGGMVANNSGGELTLAYGKTANYVRRLKAVLSDGHEYTLRPLSTKELNQKKGLKTFEGKVYRRLHKLLDQNYNLIQAAKPNVSKNSAGYALWDIWDRKTFDLTKLFVGSQGTLGIITEATFNLIRPKPHSRLLVIFLYRLDNLAEIINAVLEEKPESFESYDDHTLKLAIRYLPEIAKLMHVGNLLSLLPQFWPEFKVVLTAGLPKLILMAEFTGEEPGVVARQAESARAQLKQFKVRTYLTERKKEEKKYWIVRRESFNLLRHHVRGKHTAPFIDDLVVRPELLPEFLPQLQRLMSRYKLIYTIAGHVGDGNFHIIPLMDMTDPKARAIVPKLAAKVYDLVLHYQGSITGEHNDGLIRTPYLRQMYGDQVYHLFNELKDIFDPNNIFNPGKKVGSGIKTAMHYLAKE